MKFQALVFYQVISATKPEEEFSRSETFNFKNLSQLTGQLVSSKELNLHLKVLFTALNPQEIKKESAFEGIIERSIKEGDKEYILKLKLTLQEIDWNVL